MEYITIPVLNGTLPRWDGGVINGLFFDLFYMRVLKKIGVGGEIFLCPFSSDSRSFYPVGVIGKIEDIQVKRFERLNNIPGMLVKIRGMDRAKAKDFFMSGMEIVARGVENFDIKKTIINGYPLICGAGWRPAGGYTEMKSPKDIAITIYGWDLESGKEVKIKGELGSLVSPEKAHTVEHGIIRSLQQYAMCTPKTLWESLKIEADELKRSVEIGFKFRLPEALGVTSSGMCGNPMTNMAHFYLSQEFLKGLKQGHNLVDSLDRARGKTMSRLVNEMDISSRQGIRALQGLKKGMVHDDSKGPLSTLKKIIYRFPLNPWS
jgi:hypothetical protein